ncbi:MAG: hypothetical protein GF418_11665, partial [Chitinivibrionales bacterium]|nr:hypothetical protein [Chitinivibrionales bacterium]
MSCIAYRQRLMAIPPAVLALCICLAFPARALDVYTPAEGDSYEPGDIINVTWDA